ncbi:LytTR family DNA-binding domain-containing protein [Flavitalea sp. BT771]|uniref:LytR/AlgR family response regulator transcription factor n=1 Tax=Flavitalea sp. BT771 TaxID=3063329 RepID=UPI0026E3E033|nr:LytTR family DNA-binding domain-containing protein [Flavitalea sp. BT771]MDO6435211.1 LytTR family DNA-binding domain-containing protein [Flavitalea sp. BT771]MDV6224084.1 LytTR family DNA-binding domain-containing protein [Flavitalea sp. BT771]
MIKALIIEDEELIAAELKLKIKQVAEDVHITEVLPSLKVARKWFFENAEPDMIFMDIQLSDGVSFDLFGSYKINCPVVFTTAYEEYAVRAFKVNGVDYLLKPVDEEELKTAIDKCRNIIEYKSSLPVDMPRLIQNLQNPNGAKVFYKEKFIVNFRNQWFAVNTKDIACITKEGLHYIYTFNGEKHIIDYASMEEIEDMLDPAVFYRANRQYIVHIEAIQSVTPKENQKVMLTLKAPLKIQVDMSREKAPAFKKWMDR